MLWTPKAGFASVLSPLSVCLSSLHHCPALTSLENDGQHQPCPLWTGIFGERALLQGEEEEMVEKNGFTRGCQPRAGKPNQQNWLQMKNDPNNPPDTYTHTHRKTTSGFRTSAPCACVALLEIFVCLVKLIVGTFFYFCNKKKTSWKNDLDQVSCKVEEGNQPPCPRALP